LIEWVLTRIEILLVGLILTIGVADLGLEVVLLVEYVITDTFKIGVLRIGIEVDLNNAIADGGQKLLLR
jgi:hypothetical protein